MCLFEYIVSHSHESEPLCSRLVDCYAAALVRAYTGWWTWHYTSKELSLLKAFPLSLLSFSAKADSTAAVRPPISLSHLHPVSHVLKSNGKLLYRHRKYLILCQCEKKNFNRYVLTLHEEVSSSSNVRVSSSTWSVCTENDKVSWM